MKIVLLAHSFPPVIGGAESNIYTVAKLLSERGHTVNVVTGEIPVDVPMKERPAGHFLLHEVLGFRDFSDGKIPYQQFVFNLYQVLRRIDFDVIHIHNFAPFLAYAFMQKVFKAKVCFTYHSTPVPEEGKIIGYFKDFDLEKSFAAFIFEKLPYDKLICHSKYYLEWGIKLGAKKSKSVVSYPGIDATLFYPRQDKTIRQNLGYKDDDFVVLSPLRLIARKGVFDLLNVVPLIEDKKVKFLISTSLKVPDTSFKDKVEDTIQSLKISNRVRLLYDSVSHDQMPSIYSASNLIVLPSRVEGLGLILPEAMACGKPVIGARTSGILEIIEHGENGLLVKPKDPQGLAEAIQEIRNSDSLRRKFVEQGFITVKQKFNAQKQVERLEKIYRTL